MALVDNAWYIHFGNGSSTGYYAVPVWSNHTAVAGEIIRQATAPAVGSERCFVCTTAGATGAVEPTWTTTRGALNTSSAAVYQECTGIAGLNGDLTNTPNWTTVKNTAVTLGQVIQRNSGGSLQICTVAGTASNGAEPSFSNTAGVTTTDGGVTWTSLGAPGGFTIWSAPHARLANAYAANWGQAGNDFYDCDAGAETQAAAMTLTSPGAATGSKPTRTLSVRAASSAPPVAADLTTALAIVTTGNFAMTLGGYGYFEGITFSAGSGAIAAAMNVTTAAGLQYYKNCTLKKAGTATNAAGLAFGTTTAATYCDTVLDNTKLQFGATGDSISLRSGGFYWCNTPSAIAGSTFPTTLFGSSNNFATTALIEGVDLSALTGTIVGAQSAASKFLFRNCKFNASATFSATQTVPGAQVDLVNCSSDSKNYRRERYNMMGTMTTEIVIVRTGNGTDGLPGATDGTTPVSWKFVTTANVKPHIPFKSPPIMLKNTVVGTPVTLTVECVIDAGAVLNDEDMWLEIEGLGTASFPLSVFYNDNKATVLSAAAAQTASTIAWTTTGLSTPQKFKLQVTFTPQIAGDITARICVAKPSTTVYADPKLTKS